jgi:hypothetical protein
MTDRNESTHDRLNRELARLKYRNLSYWGGWALLIGITAFFAFAYLKHPTSVRYVEGIAGQTTPLKSEARLRLQMSVTVEGQQRLLILPSQLVHPAVGDTVCLRAGVHRFTRHTSYVSVSKSLCDGPSATQNDD